MLKFIDKLFNKYRFARRFSLFWALALITYVVVKVLEPTIILGITTAGATVVVSFVGILATIVGFYQVHRSQDKDDR